MNEYINNVQFMYLCIYIGECIACAILELAKCISYQLYCTSLNNLRVENNFLAKFFYLFLVVFFFFFFHAFSTMQSGIEYVLLYLSVYFVFMYCMYKSMSFGTWNKNHKKEENKIKDIYRHTLEGTLSYLNATKWWWLVTVLFYTI